MDVSRRQFLAGSLGGLALTAVGCNEAVKTTGGLPMIWPDVAEPPVPRGEGSTTGYRPDAPGAPHVTVDGVLGRVLSRSKWTQAKAIRSRIRRMGGIERITIHHEGMEDAVWFSDEARVRDRLELVRRSHVGRGFADLGYHYVIDRAGRIWEGRSLSYQGAHVKHQNPHNIGVMVMGNFELQSPTQPQLVTLTGAVRELRAKYRVPRRSVFTHRELGPTTCPGKRLQTNVVALRRAKQFA